RNSVGHDSSRAALPPASPVRRLRPTKFPTQLYRLSGDTAYAQPMLRPLPRLLRFTLSLRNQSVPGRVAQVRTVAKAPGGSYPFNRSATTFRIFPLLIFLGMVREIRTFFPSCA